MLAPFLHLLVDGSHTITELVHLTLCLPPPMTTMVCPPAPFSLPLLIVTQARYSHAPPKRGDHWLVEFHCNCDNDDNDDDNDDNDDKELMISRPDISICSCIVMVFIILPCACCVYFPLFLNVTPTLQENLHGACSQPRKATLRPYSDEDYSTPCEGAKVSTGDLSPSWDSTMRSPGYMLPPTQALKSLYFLLTMPSKNA